MGWMRRLLHVFRRRDDAPAWVSPQFLAMFLGLGLIAGAAFVVQRFGQGDEADSGEAAAQRAFVGLPAALVVTCPSETEGAASKAAWEAANPGAQVRSWSPVMERGCLVGYWVEYAETVET